MVSALAQLAVAADPASELLQYGALGLLAMLAIYAVRVLFTQQTAAAERDRARGDRLEEELRASNAAMQEKVLPVLSAAIELIRDQERAIELIRDQERRP